MTTAAPLKDLEFLAVDELSPAAAPSLGRLADEKVRRLTSLLELLQLFEEDASVASTDASQASADSTGDPPSTIFLVHGRDTEAREMVHRFLHNVTEIPVVVLSSQPNRGQTTIEKLSHHLNRQAFVVVLMTADDEGKLRGDPELNLRARQNVLLELGFALGVVGRRNVAVLYEDGVELPSDYYGVAYTAFDAGGGWKLPLIAELKAAGISADANKGME